MIRVNVTGTGAFLTRFGKMQAEIQNRLAEAMNISVRDVQERAREKHDFTTRTGEAERSIDKKVEGKGLRVSGTVGATRLVTIYLHQGTKPHTIVPRKKKALRWADGSGFIFSRRVCHPGMKGAPFIYNAADAERVNIVRRFDKIFDNLG